MRTLVSLCLDYQTSGCFFTLRTITNVCQWLGREKRVEEVFEKSGNNAAASASGCAYFK